jgi:hypothetical protein
LLPISFSKSDCEKPLLHKNPQQRYTVFTSFDARIKFFKFHRVIFPGINAGSQYINQRAVRVMFQKILNEFTCLFVIFADELPPSRGTILARSFTALLASLIIQTC